MERPESARIADRRQTLVMPIWSVCAWWKGRPQVRVECVSRLSEALEFLSKETPVAGTAGFEPARQSRGRHLSQNQGKPRPMCRVVILSGQEDEGNGG